MHLIRMVKLIALLLGVLILRWYLNSRLPIFTGWWNERFVRKRLTTLGPQKYKLLNDILLCSDGNSETTQIDHIVVSNYGIFCIETKGHCGWIFGNAKQTYWTQVIYKKKSRFYNPLRQNFGHMKAIEKCLGKKLSNKQITSLVIFPSADKLNISGTDKVGRARDIVRFIKDQSEVVFSDQERDGIFAMLQQSNILDKRIRKEHVRSVRSIIRNAR